VSSRARSEDRLTLEQQICFALTVADRRIVAVYRPFLEPLGLTHPQYLLMIALWQHGPLTMRNLGRQLALDSGTLSPLVQRLEKAGLLERRRGREDERTVIVALTEKGAALRERARTVPESVIGRLGMDVEQLERLRVALLELVGAAAAATRG
jgi:MarR family transcriptional regulator, organic hydroperoxide resistance regulator